MPPVQVHDTSVRAVIPQEAQGMLAMCGLPGLRVSHDGSGYFDPEYAALTFEYLASLDVTLFYLFMEEFELPPMSKQLIEELGRTSKIAINWIPIVDYGIPEATSEALWKFGRAQRSDCLEDGHSIAVSCAYGAGRCGMMAAAIIAEMGIDKKNAVGYVRKHFAEAVGSMEQERWIAKGSFLA